MLPTEMVKHLHQTEECLLISFHRLRVPSLVRLHVREYGGSVVELPPTHGTDVGLAHPMRRLDVLPQVLLAGEAFTAQVAVLGLLLAARCHVTRKVPGVEVLPAAESALEGTDPIVAIHVCLQL